MDIKHYQNLVSGLHIMKGSIFDKQGEGFSFSVNGPKGPWQFIKSLDYFENKENIEKADRDLIPYRRHLELRKIYPYLYISHGAVWILNTRYPDTDGEGVRLDKSFTMNNEPHELLAELNEEGRMLHEDPKNRFFCTICKKTYLKEGPKNANGDSLAELINVRMNRYGDWLWSGVYCDICIESDSKLKAEIHRSKTDPKYYD